jgi:hypothetical protein
MFPARCRPIQSRQSNRAVTDLGGRQARDVGPRRSKTIAFELPASNDVSLDEACDPF